MRPEIITGYSERTGIEYLVTQSLDYLMTEDNDFIVTNDSLLSEYGNRTSITTNYN